MLRMSTHGMRMFTERNLYRGRHGQESEEGKEDRQGRYQEGGKEDCKEKEVVAPTTGRLRLRITPRTQSETSPIGSETSFSRTVSRQGKIRPDLCAGGYCIKVRFFISALASGVICSAAASRQRRAAEIHSLTYLNRSE